MAGKQDRNTASQRPSAPTGRSVGSLGKTRASQACKACRTRKIKCDLVRSGPPCHNCKLDAVDCEPAGSRRSRPHRLRADIPGDQATFFSTFPVQVAKDPAHISRPEVGSTTSTALNLPPDQQIPRRTPRLSCKNAGQPVHDAVPLIRPASGNGIEGRLASFILPPERQFRDAEIKYLVESGALSIPDETLRDHLIHCYITYVYPYLPVICLEDFFKALESPPGSDAPQISLILFQAVMFAGVTSADEQYLHQAGFDDRRSAQDALFHKIKVLYDFDWEVDRITLVQVLLLHTYWYISEKQFKCPWHWIGICISLAISVGLNEESTYAGQDPKSKSLWRRLWWCCYIRDRITGLGMRRPMRLQDEQINVPMLSLNDFDLHPSTTAIPGLKRTLSVLTHDNRVAAAKLLMAKVTLVSIIGRMLNSLYILEVFDGPSTRPRMLYTPKVSSIDPVEARHLSSDLQQWENDLPKECRLQNHDDDGEPVAQFLYIHRVYLNMVVLVTTEALHRPINLNRQQQTTLAMTTLQSKSGRLLKDCAMDMAELIQQLRQKDLLHRLPPMTVTCLGAAIATFLGELKQTGRSLADLPRQCYQCIRGLWSLRDVWPITDDGCQVVGHMIRATQDASVWTLAMKARPLRQRVAAANADVSAQRKEVVNEQGVREPGAAECPGPSTETDPLVPIAHVEAAAPLDLGGVDLGFWWGQGDQMTIDLDDLDATFLEPMDHYSNNSTAGEQSSICEYMA